MFSITIEISFIEAVKRLKINTKVKRLLKSNLKEVYT